LFANLILHHSNTISYKDIEKESLVKLYSMSLKSQLASVRIFGIQNLTNDLHHLDDFKIQLTELKKVEKNEKVLALLTAIKI
jgi:glutaminyl-tRNA synthetase